MYVIQLFLPLADNQGIPFGRECIERVKDELVQRFGGVTAYNRAPAEGVWTQDGARQHDDIVIVEVMADTLDKAWWRAFRHRLEEMLQQDLIVIRAQEAQAL